MKKNLFVLLTSILVLLAGCGVSDKPTKIDSDKWFSENGVSIEESFNEQVEKFQYIKDFEDYISYNVLSITQDKPFTSYFSFSVSFDKNSSVQGGFTTFQKKFSETHDLEVSDIEFDVEVKEKEPLNFSGSLSLLYKNNELYAKLHNLGVFMGEGNMVAKMYSLLGDLVVDNWVNLEVHSGGVVTINEEVDEKLPYIIGTIKNILKTDNIESSPDFLGSIVEGIDIVNSYINLGISTDELVLLNHEISYYELSDKIIQKEFVGLFQGKYSAFDLSFSSSSNGLEVRLYNIKQYDENISDFKNIDSEILFTLGKNKESEYSIKISLLKSQQTVVDLQGKIKYGNLVKIFANYIIEPTEIFAGKKISGTIDGNIVKTLGTGDEKIPELTGNILLFSDLLSSL